jgi:ABC-2 type transport system permease protein
MSMGVAAIAVTLVVIAALLAGKLTISLGQVLTIWAVLIVGTIPFRAIGLFIGTLVSGAAALAYGNLVFLPMMWLSGHFIPLPDFRSVSRASSSSASSRRRPPAACSSA